MQNREFGFRLTKSSKIGKSKLVDVDYVCHNGTTYKEGSFKNVSQKNLSTIVNRYEQEGYQITYCKK